MEIAMGLLLRIGVIIAAVLVAVGGALVLRHPASPVPNYTRVSSPGRACSSRLSECALPFYLRRS